MKTLPCLVLVSLLASGAHAHFAENRTSHARKADDLNESWSLRQQSHRSSTRAECQSPALGHGHSEWSKYSYKSEQLAKIEEFAALEGRDLSKREKRQAARDLRELNREVDRRFFGSEAARQLYLMEKRAQGR